VDEYTAEFLRLSRFAPYMVADEENRASTLARPENEDPDISYTPTAQDVFSGSHHRSRSRTGTGEKEPR